MRTVSLTLVAVLAVAAPLRAQDSTAARRGAPKWGPAPAVFPAGAEMAVMKGDPSKAGPFTVRMRMPDGYRIPPHWHPSAEHVTVRSGALMVGMGDSANYAKARTLKAGQTRDIAARMHHYAGAKGATEIAVSARGPFTLTYVNPADDPQKTKTVP